VGVTATAPTRAPTNGRHRDASVAERTSRGKAARRAVPRSSHAGWTPPAGRGDPVALLEKQAESRVPELVPIRYGRMAASPFAFFRGGAYVMAADLAETPHSGITVQLCGDAHLTNFGGFAGPDRRLLFDLNDFDETLPGPWEWDLKRLAASLAVASRQRHLDTSTRRRIVIAAVGRYRETMRDFAQMRNLAVWYSHLDVEEALSTLGKRADGRELKRARSRAAKAQRKDNLRAFAKLTEEVDGEPRLISDPPLLVPGGELFERYGLGDREALDDTVRGLLHAYRNSLRRDLRRLIDGYRYVDLAHKVVGVGSVGTRAWVVLLLGRDNDDPLFLQVKEAERSVIEAFAPRSRFKNQGQRVVEGQRLMQAAGDIMLGWIRTIGFDGEERDFYVRQLWDWKVSADVDAMSASTLELYGEVCGGTLARAHARAGDRIAIAAYLGRSDRFDRALADFAEGYADQNERDYEKFLEALDSGRIQAQMGV
jgi:uncharacterized protein (DUF2252 family)